MFIDNLTVAVFLNLVRVDSSMAWLVEASDIDTQEKFVLNICDLEGVSV